MKTRILLATIVLFIVFAGYLIYFFFLSPQTPSGQILFYTSTNGAYRSLIKQENWDRFSPHTFSISKIFSNGLELVVLNKQDSIRVPVLLIPLSKDSLTISWHAIFPASANQTFQFKKRWQYDDVKNKMDKVLKKFQQFVAHNENIYGVPILETSTKDTLLVVTRFSTDSLPSNQIIYTHIDKLRSYSQQNGATVTGFPMLNISTNDSSTFNCMVALPVNRIIEGSGPVFFVRMVPGRFLTTEVTGGPYTINNAHRMMDQYFKDFNRVSMAIPFEYLVTDRLKETDTAKWITRLYGPVY